jgi:hypothetical protein
MSNDLRIEPKFRDLISPLSPDERAGLEAKLKAEGCREELKAWGNDPAGRSLIDGHNRREICEANGIPYAVHDLQFPDEESVIAWILLNQLGRRNLTDDQRAFYAGRLKDAQSAIEKRERARAGRAAGGKATPEQVAARLSAPAPTSGSGKTPDAKKKDSRKSAAGAAKVTEAKLRAAEAIEKADPALARKVMRGELTLREASKIVRERAKAEAAKSAPQADPLDGEGCSDAAPAEKTGGPETQETEDVTATDLAGNPIPTRELAAVFAEGEAHHGAALNLLTQLSRLINPILGDAKEKKPLPSGLHTAGERQQILNDLRNLRTSLAQTRPYGVCPYCRGKGGKCQGCKGGGWVPLSVYESAPGDYRANLAAKSSPDKAA